MAIEERVFSLELHLCMKRYCWRWSRAKIVAIVETKMQLVLGKKHLGYNNKRIQKSANFELKFKVLENLRKPLTLKSTRKRIDIDFERVSNVCALARLTKIENVWICSGGFSDSWFVRYRFFAWNLPCNSLVRQQIFLYYRKRQLCIAKR